MAIAYMSVRSTSPNFNGTSHPHRRLEELDPSGATQDSSRPMSGPSHRKGKSNHMQSKQDIVYIPAWAISNYKSGA